VADTVAGAETVSASGLAEPPAAPPQELNVQPGAGTGVNVVVVPEAYEAVLGERATTPDPVTGVSSG
jgi:hypothetical protein